MDYKEIFTKIKSLKEEEFKNFVEERIAELRKEGFSKNVGNDGFCSDFIFPDTKLSVSHSMALSMDDTKVYENFIKRISEQESFNSSVVFNIIFGEQLEYFGSGTNEQERRYIFSDSMFYPAGIPISEFKDKGAAQCSERNALAHNMLKLLGIDSTFMNGQVSSETTNNLNGLHAFNVITTPKGRKGILDMSIYSVIEKNDGKVMAPTEFYVSEDDFEKFTKGTGKLATNHERMEQVWEGKVISEKANYVAAKEFVEENQRENNENLSKKRKLYENMMEGHDTTPAERAKSLQVFTSIMDGTFVASKKTAPPTTIPGPELKQEYGILTPEKNLEAQTAELKAQKMRNIMLGKDTTQINQDIKINSLEMRR